MRRETIYETCVGNVLLLTGCELNQLYESRREDYVEARMLLVGWLIGYGFTEGEICKMSGMHQQRVNFLKNEASKRFNQRVLLRQMRADLSEAMAQIL